MPLIKRFPLTKANFKWCLGGSVEIKQQGNHVYFHCKLEKTNTWGLTFHHNSKPLKVPKILYTVNKKAPPLSSDVHWHSPRSYQQTLTLMIWLLLSLTSWKFFAQLQSDHGSNWLHFFLAPKSSQPTSNTSNPLAQFSPGKGWMCVNGKYHNCLIFSLQFETWRSGSFLVLWYKSLHD